MAIWLAGWSGDNAGAVVGRQNNRLLVSLTISDGTFPPGLFQRGDLQGTPWYFDIYVSCLTPGSRDAIAVACDQQGDSYVWSIQVAEVDWGLGKAPWQPGINLFSVMLLAAGGHQSGTIVSANIDDNLTRIDMSQQMQNVFSFAMRSRLR
jgi:hypothetical protein